MAYAVKVQQLVGALPLGAAMEWADDLRLAMLGIVKANEPPPVVKKEPKPDIIVDDDEYGEY